MPPLVNTIAEVYGKKLKRSLDPLREIVVTNGANGALNVIINALVNKGDELIVFEPCFPPYIDHLELAGGTLKSVGLFKEKNGHFTFS